MRKKTVILLFNLLLLLGHFNSIAQVGVASRPKIGLTLSGGGAKGLAHIGILKALDSAGLKVDYITGTSMGSIIGGLYAIGYSADSIEKAARNIQWDILLSNQASLRTLFMEEKGEYDKYLVELPWVNHNFQLPTGVLQGQELWLKLSELYFPAHDIKDFSKFSIPFKCIATDVGSGEAVVLSKGEITNAIRASMAIPSFFTAVDYEGHRLVDGGVVRNFPVRDVKQMGADFVIGSNVAGPLLPSNKVSNVIQVLLQVAFFREEQDHKEEVSLCDIYVPFDMAQYNMGSFSQASQILDYGIEVGRTLYPRFKKLADSLNQIYGSQPGPTNRLPGADSVKISSYEVRGLEHTTSDFFVHTMDLLTSHYYNSAKLSRMTRAAFGTRYYNRVNYSLEALPDSTYKIIFDVTENPLTFAKFALHYNKFSGIAAIANLTSRNLLFANSRDLISVNIGENFRARVEHLQYLGRRSNFSSTINAQYDLFDVNTYSAFKQVGIYRKAFFKGDARIQYSSLRNFAVGVGERFETISYSPSISNGFQYSGSSNFFTTYAFLEHNTLDRVVYPRRGIKLNTEIGYISEQSTDVIFYLNDQPVRPDSLKPSTSGYPRFIFNFEGFIPLSSRSTVELLWQSGINFNYDNHIMNEFVVGGLTPLFRNQVLFAGLNEGSLYTPAMATLQAGYRFEMFTNTFLIGRANVLVNNFISKNVFFQNPNVLSGYSLSFGYNFALGPLEFSLMYCDQSKKLASYVNIGIPF